MNICLKTISSSPEIYVACAASQEQGITHGVWVNAALKVKDMAAEIAGMLAKSPVSGAKTFLIREHRGFGSFEIHPHESLKRVRLKALFISVYGGLAPKLSAYYKGDLEAAIEALNSHYIGVYDSEREYASTLFETNYLPNIPPKVQPYIDYQQFQKDIFIDDYF